MTERNAESAALALAAPFPVHDAAGAAHRRNMPLARWIWLGWLVVLMIGCGFVSISHGADGMWDLKNYHLYSPFAALNDRYDYDVAPAQQPGYLNPLLDYPFYFAVRLFNDYPRVIAFLMGLPQGVNLWLLGIMAWRISGEHSRVVRVGLTLVATWIGGTGAGTLPLVGATTGDVVVSVPVLAAFVMLLRAVDARPVSPIVRRSLLACGLLVGCAVGAKPTMGCYALGLCAALLVVLPLQALPGALLRFAVAGGVGVVATGGYHALRLAKVFGNPMFPLANTLFHSPFWENASFRDTRFLPKDLWEAVTFPFIWASGTDHGVAAELGFRDIRVALGLSAVVLAVATLLFARGDARAPLPRSILALFVASVVAYVAWIAGFSIYRFLLPTEMLSGVLVLAALSQIARPAAAPVLMAVAAFACSITTLPLEWGHTPFRDHYVEVSAPPIEPDALILIVGADPVAYFIPFMDPSARWLGLDNNLLRPNQGNALVARERSLIERQSGAIMVMHAGAPPAEVSAVLAAYGLTEDADRCGQVSSNLGGEAYTLCSAHRAAG